MKINSIPAVLLVTFLAICSARAEDQVKLADGTVLKGKAILRGNICTIDTGKKWFQFNKRQIAEINGKALESDDPIALIKTDLGDIKVKLFEDDTPNTTANFIRLAEEGFYKGQSFHRIIPGFMAQGGCPNSKIGAKGIPGTGGPGYKIKDEFAPGLTHNGKGILSMANSGPDTNGSQFFICFGPAPHLNNKHTVFGQVVEGMEVLDKLEKIGSGSGKTSKRIGFDVKILSKREHPYKITKVAGRPRPKMRPKRK